MALQQKTYFLGPSKSRPSKTVHQPDGTVDVTQAYHFAPTISDANATNASSIEVPTKEPNTEPLPELSQLQTPTTTRSGRSSRPPERLIATMTAIANYNGTHKLDYQHLHPWLLFKATTNPDILYMNEALAAPDGK